MADTTKTHGRSTAGVKLTDDVLNTMADEAEAGLDVTKLRRRPGRPSMGSGPADTLPVRLDPELRQAVEHAPRRTTRPRPMSSASPCADTSRRADETRLPARHAATDEQADSPHPPT